MQSVIQTFDGYPIPFMPLSFHHSESQYREFLLLRTRRHLNLNLMMRLLIAVTYYYGIAVSPAYREGIIFAYLFSVHGYDGFSMTVELYKNSSAALEALIDGRIQYVMEDSMSAGFLVDGWNGTDRKDQGNQ